MAKSFPTKACPKCGKDIHARKMNHDCGWTANKASAATKASNGKAAKSSDVNRMDAVRQILAEHGKDIKPKEIQAQVKSQFGVTMEPSVISNYKSTLLKKGLTKKRGGGATTAASRSSMIRSVHRSVETGGFSIDDIKAVKDLAERIGVDKLRLLAEVLAT